MKKSFLEKIRSQLLNHRELLLEWLRRNPRFAPVRLGRVGDGALEVEEACDAIASINEALDSIDRGDFGQCDLCEGTVETARLELDYTTRVCLAHYSKDEISRLERDLEMAAQVQRQLAPCCIPSENGLEIAAYAEAASIVSGDYHDFFRFSDGDAGIIVADVMGKGLSASMLMANIQASVRILAPELPGPAQLAARLNELFQNNISLIRFISVFLAKIDLQRGQLTYCNAGHHPPILWHAGQQRLNWLNPTGPAIGLTRNARFEASEAAFAAADLLFLYTDGLIEARKANGEEFGEDNLAAFVKANGATDPQTLIDKLRDRVQSGLYQLHDDLSLVAVKAANAAA